MTAALQGRTRHRTLTHAGARVHYWEYLPDIPTAEPRDEPARTMLVVHGFRGDHHGLLRVVEALPEMHIIMPDLPGFGISEPFPDGGHDIPGYADFVEGFLDALELPADTVLLGHSFGSIVASHFVATHPGRVSPLILVNPIASPALEGPKGVLSKLALGYYVASARLPEALGLALLRSRIVVRLMSVTMAKTRDKALRRFIHGQHDAYFSSFANRDMLLESFRASIAGTVRQVAARLELPVLLVAGADDDIAPLPTQHRLLELLPDGELSVIPGVGHLIHYETPKEAARAIRSFLERHPA